MPNPDPTPAAAAPAAPPQPIPPAAAAPPAGEAPKPGAPTPAAPPPAAPAGTPAVEPPKPGEPGGAPAPTVPEKYELTVPEGGRLTEADVTSVEAIAREAGWTKDEAQAALESHAAALDAQSERFLTETTADPEYGGEKLVETQRRATALLDRVRPKGTPRGDAIRALLDRSGYGNHVEVVSLLADLGKLMGEDAPPIADGGRKPADVGAAEKLYDGKG